VQNMDDNEFEEWKRGVQEGVYDSDWADLAAHPKLAKSVEDLPAPHVSKADDRHACFSYKT